MVFQGYLSIGGTEVINQARTTAYTAHGLPKLDLRECDGCEDFHEVLGHAPYQSPLVDQPDWYDEANVDSWDFYGLYPLEVQGFDDGTTAVTVTELMTDGSAVSVPRRASRQMRVTGLLVGRTDAAISYGMVWLRNALLGNACDSQLTCTGDHLCYFTACPPICEDSPEYPTPAEPGALRGCEDGLVLDPISQCTAPYERILYDVTLLDGPRVVEQYPSDCANYVRVEFTLVAATPSPVGIAKRAVSFNSISRPPVLIPETPCTADGGVMQRRNMMRSPKVLRDTLPGEWVWGARVGGRYRIDLEVSPPVDSGAFDMASLSDEVPDDDGTTLMSQLDDVGIWRRKLSEPATALPASPGMDVTASVYARTSRDGKALLWFDYVDIDGEPLGQTSVGVADLVAGSWGRVEVTFIAPPGAAYLHGHASTISVGSGSVPGDMTWWGAGLLEYGQSALTYFDGDTRDTGLIRYSWSRGRNQSSSLAERVVIHRLVDPGCDVIPRAPRAPLIEDSCVDDTVQWRRYQYVLNPDLVPVWSDALPYVTIHADKREVRQVRVRFYPNPASHDLADVEPCNFCGEFIVSYIPPHSVLTVDAIRQQAYVTSRGGVVRSASHLLYGSDGGPMQWSALTCGIEYTMTVDVAPTAITGIKTQLCLAARE